MKTQLTALGMAIGTLGASLPACAQNNNTLPTVSVTATSLGSLGLDQPSATGSRLGLTPMETPASIATLDADAIAERSITRAQDAAVQLPGLSQAPEPGNGGSSLSARGFAGHSSVAQMIDGTRLVVAFGTVTYPFSTWPLASVDVLSGPASVLYGDGAIGAAVNYVTKRPVFDRTEREAFLSYGSFNTVQGGVGLRGPINEVAAYSVYVDASKSDGERRDSAYERQNYALALSLRPSRDLNVTLSLDGGRNNDARYYGTPLLPDGSVDKRLIDTSFNVGNALVRYKDDMWRAKVEYRVNDDVQLHNETYYLTAKRHWRNSEDYYFDDSGTQVVRDSFLEILHDQKQTGNRTDLSISGTLGGLKNQLVAGLDWYRTTLLHTNNSPYVDGDSVVDPYKVVPGVFDSLSPTAPGRHSALSNTAVFAEDVLSLNPQWKLVAGLRRESMSLEYDNLRTKVNQHQKYSPTTGRLGAVWSPSSALSVYGQFSTGTDPLTGSLTLPAGATNVELTRGRQVEVGAKGALPAIRGQWTVAAYRIVKDHLYSQDPLNPDLTQQIGKQSSTGIELAVGAEPVRGWTIDANLAALRARYDRFDEQQDDGSLISRAGNTPYGVPERTANVWSTVRVASQWKLGLGARYVGKVQYDAANEGHLPSYTVLNGSVAFAYSPATSVTLSVNNLANKVYATSGYSYLWLLGERRNAQLTVRSSF
ncbi:TonB-dependent receptor [Paucibacter sp. R3-3]|uniref:TonB-dependent receptor n=1 Tax=Roseateles agri TaxID=3098619 RepID=A0ABU5DIM8_9BURK|nr:TonB-dependent receptor [Paucibacter sp. R3-3]MDY0745575.1 TonB-dependent receptor [Paucibacter sp. R3-3]